MKNKWIILSAFLIIFSLTFVHAASNETTLKDLQEKKDQAEQIKAQIEQNKTNFLLHSWTDYLSKTSFGRILIQISSVLEYLSPVFVAFVGMKYELSWLFFISIIVAVWIGTIIYRSVKVISSGNGAITFILTLAILGLIVRRSTIQNSLEFFSPVFSNPVITILSIVICSAIVVAYNIIMKKIGKKIEEQKKKEKEQKREADKEILDKVNEVKIVAAGGKSAQGGLPLLQVLNLMRKDGAIIDSTKESKNYSITIILGIIALIIALIILYIIIF